MKHYAILYFLAFLMAACSDVGSSKQAETEITKNELKRSPVHSAIADKAALNILSEYGRQETFAMMGWQQNADYKPADQCFSHWNGESDVFLNEEYLSASYCQSHVQDLSRLYESYGMNVNPIIFKSEYFWSELKQFNINTFPKLVEAWESSGGNEDDTSFLKHPVCAKPLQEGWTGSDFFYDGNEHPLCRFYKIEAMEALDPLRQELRKSKADLEKIEKEILENIQADQYRSEFGVERSQLLSSFQESQAAWHRHFEAECRAIGVLLAQEPTAAADDFRCKTELNRRRIMDLRRVYL